MDVEKLFRLYAGESVLYVSHVDTGRQLTIRYTVPAYDPSRTAKIEVHLGDGTAAAYNTAILRAATSARGHADMLTGKHRDDLNALLRKKPK